MNNLYSNLTFSNIAYDTRDVGKNTIFFCINERSYAFIEEAIKLGAVAIVSNRDLDVKVLVYVVDDVYFALSKYSALYYGFPTKYLKVVGYTGTDGKTTSSLILKSILDNLSTCGYIGTNGIMYDDVVIKHYCTTPFPNHLHKYLQAMVNALQEYVVIEATSQGLDLKRVDDVEFDLAVITNITSDHLDHHKTMENYINAKLHLLDLVKKDGYVILNKDDISYDYFSAKWDKILTYGINNDADFMATNIKYDTKQMEFDVVYQDVSYPFVVNLIGDFNIYNCLSVVACLVSYGYKIPDFVKHFKRINTLEGRSNFIDNDLDIDIIIDFAHTANGVEQLLKYHQKVLKANSKLITLMGCPGRRDATKRSKLGKILTTYSDFAIFTADDPRDEPIADILKAMESGAINDHYIKIACRKEAIAYAIKQASPGDVVILLGKGAENKFAIGNQEIDYLEADVVKAVLQSLEV